MSDEKPINLKDPDHETRFSRSFGRSPRSYGARSTETSTR
jgi:hypothetical protein